MQGGVKPRIVSGELNQALLSAIPDLVFRLGADGTVLDFLPSKEGVLHAPPEAFMGRRLAEVLPPNVAQQSVEKIHDALQSGRTVTHEYDLDGRTGRRHYEARLVANGPDEVLALVRDVTDRKQAEERLQALYEEAERARKEAEEAVRARDEFLSIASHELRTPITSMRGTAQLIVRSRQRGQLDDERLERYLLRIEAEGHRLAALTDDLLDVARLRTGRVELRPERIDLLSFVRDVVARFEDGLSDDYAVRLRVDAAQCAVMADPLRLEQVLTNLLSNAAKYSPGGGTLEVSVCDDGDGVCVEVSDQGIGLPREYLEAIFTPFGRAPNAAERQIQGLGLGLYICRELAERHGGRIWANSPGEGQGTTFSLWLPCAPSA